MEPMPVSFTGVIHYPRLKDRLATHFVPFAEFEEDAAEGTLPDFSLIEPNMLTGHGDYHPAFGRSFSAAVDLKMDSPSAMLGGEAFLERVFNAYRSATSETGTNVWNTALLIGWESVGRLIHPVSIAFAEAIPIAALGLVVNLVSAWLLMLFAGGFARDVGIRPFGYLTAMVVTIALWLAVAPAVGAIARTGRGWHKPDGKD